MGHYAMGQQYSMGYNPTVGDWRLANRPELPKRGVGL